MNEKNLVIVDLDGTLADSSHRAVHLQQNKDWDRYYENVGLDIPHEDIIAMVNALKASGYCVIIISARREETRKETEGWLRHYCVSYDALVLRPIGCRTDDHIWKPDIISLFGKHNVLLVVEDRNRIVDQLRHDGLRVVQVAPGDF